MKSISAFGPLKPFSRYLARPKTLLNELEMLLDIWRTRQSVGKWAHIPIDLPNNDRVFAIISFTNFPFHAKFHCLAAKAMQLRGFTPLILTNSGMHFAHQYYRMFGIDRLVMWDEFTERNCWAKDQAQQFVDSLNLIHPSVSMVKAVQFHGVDVGKHALSLTCRRRVEGKLNLQNPETLATFREWLERAILNVLLVEQFLVENPVEKMLVRDAGYIPSGQFFEVALNKGVDCVVLEFGQRRSTWVFKRYTPETKGRHYFSLALSTWERVLQMPWTHEEDVRVEREFEGRYRPDSMDDTRRLQSSKSIKSSDDVRAQLGLDPKKKTAVIFSHVAWDAAFFFGEGLFEDFEDWLFQTAKFVVTECPQMNWIIKEHPFNVFKLQRESIKETSESRLLKPLLPFPGHVRFMPADTDINTQSLFPLVDYVLTVNGTVGMEFPCYGIPAVLAGTGRYDGFGFTIEPKTQTEYFQTLRNLHQIPKLESKARQLARRHYLAMMVGKQISFADVAPMELKRLHEAQSDVHDNIRFIAPSLDAFRNAHSVNLLGKWLAESSDFDLLELSQQN